MRIRKNARRIVKGGLSNSSSFLICQLNRAPWDDPSFFTVGETTDSLPVSDSRETMEMELLFEYIEKTPPQSEREREKEVIEVPLEPEPVVSFLPAPVLDIPKKRGRPKKVTRRDRDRDRPANNNNNPYQFYYYSGFGPTWRKRRGGSRPNEDDYFVDMGEDNYDNVDGNGNGVETPGCSSTTRESNNTSGDEIDDDENKDKSSDNNNNSNSNGVVIESFESVREAERELDYIGDEEDEDEDGLHAGKRARKPIKARSLKSLM